MKKAILLPLLSTLMLSQVQAANPLIGPIEDVYIKGSNTLLFFTSENIISSGSYEFGSSDQTLDTLFFPMTHHFESDSDFYNFFVNGSVGYSKYQENNIDLRNDGLDELDIKTYALKLGGGIRMNIFKDADMMIGGAYIYSKVKSDYKTPDPLDTGDVLDQALDYVFNTDRDFDTYELFTSIGYHPTINEYKPYFNADIRYFDTKIDDPYATVSDSASTISKLKIGVITPSVISIKELPLKLEFYASDVLLWGDMKEALESDNFYVLGTTFHLGTSGMSDWISEVSFDINIVKGDNFDGFNFGFGFNF
jgi:hypothetical protein